MKRIAIAAAVFFSTAILSAQQIDRGWCPPLPPPDWSRISKVGPMPPAAPQQGLRFLGIVGIFATASEKGYVCEVSVVRSVNSEVDTEAKRTALNWRFRPARIGRERVGTVFVINIPVWKREDGSMLSTEGITVESPPGTVSRKP